jgi:hypothetical protein
VSAATILLFELGLTPCWCGAAGKAGRPAAGGVPPHRSRRIPPSGHGLLAARPQGGAVPLMTAGRVSIGPKDRAAPDRLRVRVILWRTMIAFPVGFAANGCPARVRPRHQRSETARSAGPRCPRKCRMPGRRLPDGAARSGHPGA